MILSNLFNKYHKYCIFFLGDKMDDNRLKEIILDNQNLIYSIIHRFRSKNMDLEDLYQAGCIGLINAYNNYDSRLNVKFTSYAYNYIVGEIYKYIINNRNIHLSPMNIKLYNSIGRAQTYLENHLGRMPTDSELCEFLEITPYKLWEIRNMINTDSLDYQYENSDLYDFIVLDNIDKDTSIDLKNALNTLTNDEKRLINARYYNNFTQQELARVYNTNQVKISREEKKILCKLKAKMY